MNDKNLTMGQTGTSCYMCPKCGKPYCYIGDVPPRGWEVGFEPYCTCGTEICPTCGKRYMPKCKDCGQ